ncbi:hypothetical protein CA234_06155 [Sphingomonas sp. ABOLE]|uniref:hypothetical protein n=1 Tax=Sphingomonas sp. ABOLE TaxID=1985878 RepID=UPI000F7E31AE|nr:hypothetical protein [Sphingomonas sp. ABOLE]RSV42823.1 hypothetical protein CA234_06155 [Sphingomonas sp. ABOLE]
MKLPCLALPLLLLGGCNTRAADPSHGQIHGSAAEWGGYAIEGIAPRMPEAAVDAALVRRGYQRTTCTTASDAEDTRSEDPSALLCYLRHDRWMVMLQFDGRQPHRTLGWMALNDRSSPLADRDRNLAQGRRFAAAMAQRFGRPDETAHGAVTTQHWYVPRGVEQRAPGRLHDMISVTISPIQGVNATLSGSQGEMRGPY